MNNKKFAVVIPLANESDTFAEFSSMLIDIFDRVKADNSFLGDAYLVVDNVSKDNTLQLCQELHERDSRFIPVWAP
jgi:dolichol-phosphate mannosyltransferase